MVHPEFHKLNFSAEHFQTLITANPPQTSSREAASHWGCHIHNKVNESLNKVRPPLDYVDIENIRLLVNY